MKLDIPSAVESIKQAAEGLVATAKNESAELQEMAGDVYRTSIAIADDVLSGDLSPEQAASGYQAMMTGVRLRLLAEQYTIQREARAAWVFALDLAFKALPLLGV